MPLDPHTKSNGGRLPSCSPRVTASFGHERQRVVDSTLSTHPSNARRWLGTSCCVVRSTLDGPASFDLDQCW